MFFLNTGSLLTGRMLLPLKGTSSIIYSSAILLLSVSYLTLAKRLESSERHPANKKSLVGGRKSGQRSKRTAEMTEVI